MSLPPNDLLGLALKSVSVAALAFAVLGIQPAAAAEVTGTAMYLERIALPPDAAFEATLEDVSRADAPSTVLGRATVNPAGQVPIRFAIPYDPAKIVPNHTYVVRGRVLRKGELLWTTTQAYPVLTRGAGSEVELKLQRVGGAKPAPGSGKAGPVSLIGTRWVLTGIGDQTVDAGKLRRTPGLQLDGESSRFSGSGGCNNMTGPYKLDGPNLGFGLIASTMAACPEEMMQVETGFSEALNRTTGYRITGRQLELLDANRAVLVRLEAGQ